MAWQKGGYSPLHIIEEPTDEFLPFEQSTAAKQEEMPAPKPKRNGRAEVDFLSEKVAAPWMAKLTAQCKNPNVKLHNELVEFTRFVEPTAADAEARERSLVE
jgi:hypothetical protein